MDIVKSPPYEEMQKTYESLFSLRFLGSDINNKFAIISLVCWITAKLKAKKPDVTHWTVLHKLGNGIVDTDYLKGLAVICSDFSYGCTQFPTFGIDEKKIPDKIKDLLRLVVPF